MSQTLEHQTRRPGYKTSEFWITVFIAALPVILPLLQEVVGKLPDGSWQAVIGSAVIGATYNISRSIVKKSRNDASAAAVMPDTVSAGGDVSLNAAPVAAPVAETEVEAPFFIDSIERGKVISSE